MASLRSFFVSLLAAALLHRGVFAEDGPKPEELHITVAAILSEFGTSVDEKDIKDCLPIGESHALQTRANKAIEKMMEGRPSKMREGMGMLGRALRLLANAVESKCSSVVAQAADLKGVGQQMEDYGKDKKFMKYVKKEKLIVDGYDLHKPTNKFIGDWKKVAAPAKLAGTSLGELFKALKGEKVKDGNDAKIKEEL